MTNLNADFSPKHEEQISKLTSEFGSKVTKTEKDRAECPIIWVDKNAVITILKFLKESNGFEYEFLSDLTAYDELGSEEEALSRFVMVYNLYSPKNHCRIRVKVRLREDDEIATATSLWAGAN